MDNTAVRFLPMESDSFFFGPGCDHNEDCGIGRGRCEKARCICNDEHYGLRCGFSYGSTCPKLAVEDSSGVFAGAREYATRYEMLRPEGNELTDVPFITIYDHPVYASASGDLGSFDVLLFSGVRWMLINSILGFPKLNRQITTDALATHLEQSGNNGFHAATSLAGIEFFTESVLFNTHNDAETPVGLEWVVTIKSFLKEI